MVIQTVDSVFVIHTQCRIWIGNWNANVVNKGLRLGMWNVESSLVDWIPRWGLFEDEDWMAEWEYNPGIHNCTVELDF